MTQDKGKLHSGDFDKSLNFNFPLLRRKSKTIETTETPQWKIQPSEACENDDQNRVLTSVNVMQLREGGIP